MAKIKENKIKKSRYLDYKIIIPYILLVSFGFIMVYSSTSYLTYLSPTYDTPEKFIFKQTLFLLISIGVMTAIYKFKNRLLRTKGVMGFAFIFVLGILILTLLFGSRVNGSKAWLKLGPMSIQGVEYFKIMVVWYLAQVLSRRQSRNYQSWKELFKDNRAPLVFIGLGILLILAQPDIGGIMIILFIATLMILSCGVDYRFTLSVFGILLFLMVVIPQIIAVFGQSMEKIPFLSHVYSRFATYQNPFLLERGAGHQLANGYYAISNGGWFGLGLGNSIQKKGFLPEPHTDFIFPIVVEEFGVVGAVILLAVLFYLIIHVYNIGRRSDDAFSSILCYGVASMILVQVLVNVGGVLGLIPMTGVTFPFISQGGNSLLVLSTGLAFALNVSAEEKKNKELEEFALFQAKIEKEMKKNEENEIKEEKSSPNNKIEVIGKMGERSY